MKKLRLTALNIGVTELLSRDEMKMVRGGSGTDCTNACGGGLGACPNGQSCSSKPCPDDAAFTHTVCG